MSRFDFILDNAEKPKENIEPERTAGRIVNIDYENGNNEFFSGNLSTPLFDLSYITTPADPFATIFSTGHHVGAIQTQRPIEQIFRSEVIFVRRFDGHRLPDAFQYDIPAFRRFYLTSYQVQNLDNIDRAEIHLRVRDNTIDTIMCIGQNISYRNFCDPVLLFDGSNQNDITPMTIAINTPQSSSFSILLMGELR